MINIDLLIFSLTFTKKVWRRDDAELSEAPSEQRGQGFLVGWSRHQI